MTSSSSASHDAAAPSSGSGGLGGASENDGVLVATGDHWLDEVTAPSQPAYNPATHAALSTFSGPARTVRRMYSFLSTTPGKLFSVTVILTLAIAAAGISMSNSSAQRQESLDVLLSTTEPMSNSAHHLYTSLSLADTVATTGFVQAGVENEANRQKYNEAIDRASIAATQSVLGTNNDDARIRELVLFIQRELPVYTSMVETARANHRFGNTVSAAYMSNASELMRSEILPAAAELFQLTSDKVSAEQKKLTSPQFIPLSGLLAAVLFLLIAQWWLWRLTRRRLNRGFLTATVLMSLAIVWVAMSNLATWTAGSHNFEEASRPWGSLTASRIEAQQARTSETLALVNRQPEENLDQSFSVTTEAINAALDDYTASESLSDDEVTARQDLVKSARFALDDWSSAHRAFEDALNSGRYDEAIRQATASTSRPGEVSTSASAFNTLDNTLSKLIADARQSMRTHIQEGLSAMTLVSTAVFILTIAAIIAVWLGIRPRLQEYL